MTKLLSQVAAAVTSIALVDVLAFVAVRAYYHFGDHFGYVQMADPLIEEFISDTVHMLYGLVK
jgi:hypothetical protein